MMEDMAPKGMPEEKKEEGGDFDSLVSQAQSCLEQAVEAAPEDKKAMIAGVLEALSESMESSADPATSDVMSAGKKGVKPMMG